MDNPSTPSPIDQAVPMLILASKSQTRRTLLANAGLDVRVQPAAINEREIQSALMRGKTTSRSDIARALAREKARSVSAKSPDALVIGADQTLECGDLDIHTPKTRADAAAQLRALAGKTHTLFSAVALARAGTVLWDHVGSAQLTLKSFSEAELDRVLTLEGEAILNSVGGYRLEGPSIRLFHAVSGDYFTVLGLPLLALLEALQQHAPALLEGVRP